MVEILINNQVLDQFEMKNLEYLYHKDYYLNLSGTHEYRLYSYLSTFFNNTIILDIGTSFGRSAIALSHNDKNKVIKSEYLNLPKNKTLALLKGLMETDGFCDKEIYPLSFKNLVISSLSIVCQTL